LRDQNHLFLVAYLFPQIHYQVSSLCVGYLSYALVSLHQSAATCSSGLPFQSNILFALLIHASFSKDKTLVGYIRYHYPQRMTLIEQCLDVKASSIL